MYKKKANIPLTLRAARGMLTIAWRVNRKIFITLFLISGLQALLPVAGAWITKYLFDQLGLVLDRPIFSDWLVFLLPIILGQAVLTVIGQVLFPIVDYLNGEMNRGLSSASEVEFYEKLGNLQGISNFEDPEFYDAIQLAKMGMFNGPAGVTNLITNIIQSTVSILGFLLSLIYVSPILAFLIILAGLPQLLLGFKVTQQRMENTVFLSSKGRLLAYLGNLLASFESVKEMRLFNLTGYLVKRFKQLQKEIHAAQRRQEVIELTSKLIFEFIASSAYSIAFVVVVFQGLTSRLTLGDVTFYINSIKGLQEAFSRLVGGLASLSENSFFFRAYQDFLNTPQPIIVPIRPRRVFGLKVGIEVRNVAFRYTANHPWILRNLNLFIPRNSKLALIGTNGSGKTTLVKLLTRFYDPDEGAILWDGVDIREFNPIELRKRLGVLLQDFGRYAFTATENIRLGDINLKSSSGKIIESAKKAGIDAKIQTLPNGYNTMLSPQFGEKESNTDLSGGEWQKLGLARLFVRDSDFLILDEPTASLDAESEYEIYSSFANLVGKRTCLLISHRLSTVKMADCVAVLENGQITEIGNHNDLLLKGGAYAKFYSMQTDRFQT